MGQPFDDGLDRNAANHAALTPASFLARAAAVYPRKLAVLHGDRVFTYAEVYARARRLASALAGFSARSGLTLEALHSANQGVGASPAPGQVLTIPPSPQGSNYTVQAGDTLAGIAERFGLTIEALRSAKHGRASSRARA